MWISEKRFTQLVERATRQAVDSVLSTPIASLLRVYCGALAIGVEAEEDLEGKPLSAATRLWGKGVHLAKGDRGELIFQSQRVVRIDLVVAYGPCVIVGCYQGSDMFSPWPDDEVPAAMISRVFNPGQTLTVKLKGI
jgi:hypothetical protein